MKIFITGATGALGKIVCKELIKLNHEVIGLSRSVENSIFINHIGAEYKEVDLFKKDEIIKATRDCDAIIHLATAIPKKTMPRKKDWLMNDKIRTMGTQILTEAAKINKVNIFIGQSITALYGNHQSSEVDEYSTLNGRNIKMLESAYRMEEIIKSTIPDNFLIFRFGTFYGPSCFHTLDLIKNIKKGRLPLIGKGDFLWNLLHINDAAQSIIYGLEEFERLRSKTLNVSDFQPIEFHKMLKGIQQMVNGKKPLQFSNMITKLLLGTDVYQFLTNSYHLTKSKELNTFELKHPNFFEEIAEIIENLKTKAIA